jgi:RTX calcium-binding nonapeptide repeat (4 copies)
VGRVCLAVCLAAVVATPIAAPDAGAFRVPPAQLTCSYEGAPANTVTFTSGLALDDVGVERDGDQIKFFTEQFYGWRPKGKKKIKWHRIVQSAACNVVPTVHNTDQIVVKTDPDESTDVNISLEGGPLGPGATPEADGTSEIETRIESSPGEDVKFVGGSANDWFRFGTTGGVQGVNLNAQEEANTPDVDATAVLAPPSPPFEDDWPGAWARTGAGNDRVTTEGGPEFDGPLGGAVIEQGGSGDDALSATSARFTGLNGGPGNDTISAAGRYTIIRAGTGNDVVIGGPGQQFVELGKGHDFASTGPGKDGISAFDHTRDRVLCGPGRDFVGRDRADKAPGCELRANRPFGIEIFGD